MALDGIVTRALVSEFNDLIVGGRVNKIYQTEKDEIILNIYSRKENYQLLISANSSAPRMHFTNIKKENPQEPPMFCMVLRKHLSGASILNIEQYSMDRIVFIDFSATDELGLPTKKRLIVEIMGRHSNIILINLDSEKIIDSVSRVSMDMSRVRQVLPGLTYSTPPAQEKLNPLEIDFNIFKETFLGYDPSQKLFKFFYMNFMGLSPLISREICFRSGLPMDRIISSLKEDDIEKLFQVFKELMDKIKSLIFVPTLVENMDKGFKDFYVLELEQFNNLNSIYPKSISEVLDLYYSKNDRLQRIQQKSSDMKKSIQTKLERVTNKLGKQKEELLESSNRELYKIYGDLISSNFHLIGEDRPKEITVDNFYSENLEKITIPLDIRYTPHVNAQRYYKKYSKLKNRENLLNQQIPETKDEIKYLEEVLLSIENAIDTLDLEDIRMELISEGYIRGRVNKKKTKAVSKPHHYLSSEGYDIYVGRNNRQNDQLTMKFANKDDIWLHVQNMPGSHVVIRNSKNHISKKVLEEASNLAAYYSSAKNSSNVAVDYTEKKNVRKPSQAKPGMVIYENFNTIFVTPNKDFIDNLKVL